MTRQVRVAILVLAIAGLAVWLAAPVVTGGKKDPDPAAGVSGSRENQRSSPPAADSDEDPESLPDERIHEWLQQAGRDTPGTLARILALPDEEERAELLDWVLSAWTSEERGPALEWLKEASPAMPAAPASQVIEYLIGGWAFEAPLDAREWAEKNLPEPVRATAFHAIAESWALAEPEAMGAWILTQRPAPDLWTEELVQGLIPTDPARALEWCDHIADAKMSEDARQTAIQSWLLSAPEEANSYLKDHPALVPATRAEEPPPPAP